MRKLLTSRLFRCTLCLILVCCLVVSWSPIRARAVGVDQFIGVAVNKVGLYAQAGALSTGAAVFAWVLLGLGLIVTTAQAIDLMNQYTEFTGELETSIYYYPDGSWSYGVDMGFIERVRAFLFDTAILDTVINEQGLSDYAATYGLSSCSITLVEEAMTHNHFFIGHGAFGSGYEWRYAYSDSGGFVLDGETLTISTGGEFFTASSSKPYWLKYSGMGSIRGIYTGAFETVISTDGLDLGVVAPLEVSMPEAYPEWHTNARPTTDPDTDEEITVLPIPLDPNTETIPDGVTQPDTWQGSIADPMPDAGTDTDPDTGTDTDPDGGTTGDSTTPPIGKFQVDLTSFFPFCIPFDLYEFIRILCAEPEAPVFHWEVQDLSGNVYSVDVDLSPWNSHAQLFRDAQCLLFIIGLLMLTRKFIKW